MALQQDELAAIHQAIAVELRAAQAAVAVHATDLAERTGIKIDTVYRILRGHRAVTSVELIQISRILGVSHLEILERAEQRALSHSPQGRRPRQSIRVGEKLSLVASSQGKTLDALYLDIVGPLSHRGFAFPRKAWQELLSGTSPARSEVLFSISEILGIDPQYLLKDDPEVEVAVEARLRFRRAMSDLGVTEVAARSVDGIAPQDLEAIGETIATALSAIRTSER
ncbi:helix-turn-helix domain-containing protein [Plantibacter sp. CFBP 8804]|uniref:helix-turn-helix domain-containing protein n=1 Tax=Plantibacter sp. CFBP 8804 TaxID=2775270 RepID=UPI0017853E27|nr:helix-turn-helix transcriptional regulator [Plantibacter sp. CFBP 8804]MBD8518866.1 helix-turn-helix transcriptional regulator [Plantibacter sp. CFBP 8804]